MRNYCKQFSSYMIKYSIIIPTYNGANRLSNTLNSILKQSIPFIDYEIIIIIDGSSDKTIGIITDYKKKKSTLNIRYKYLKSRNGAAYARNVGIVLAKGDILFFIDDDCEAPLFWMKEFITIYHKYPDIVGVGGWYTPPLDSLQKNIYEQFIYLRYRFYWGIKMDYSKGKTGKLFPLPAANGANFSVKKWVFNYVEMFNSNLYIGREDVDLSFRIQQHGFILYYLPIFMVHRKQNNTFYRFIKFCWSRTNATKQYNTEYRLSSTNDTNLYHKFSVFCQKLNKDILPFSYDKRIIFLAFIYFHIENIIMKLPFPYKKFPRRSKKKLAQAQSFTKLFLF